MVGVVGSDEALLHTKGIFHATKMPSEVVEDMHEDEEEDMHEDEEGED